MLLENEDGMLESRFNISQENMMADVHSDTSKRKKNLTLTPKSHTYLFKTNLTLW